MLTTLHALAHDLISEIRRLDERITATTAQITTAVAASGTTLTQLHGIGTLLAGKILALVGSIDRFRSAAAFASSTGTAPLRHRQPAPQCGPRPELVRAARTTALDSRADQDPFCGW